MKEQHRQERLPWAIYVAQEKLREGLGFRRETRLDEIIFMDGTVVKELPNGVFVTVRGTIDGVWGGELP